MPPISGQPMSHETNIGLSRFAVLLVRTSPVACCSSEGILGPPLPSVRSVIARWLVRSPPLRGVLQSWSEFGPSLEDSSPGVEVAGSWGKKRNCSACLSKSWRVGSEPIPPFSSRTFGVGQLYSKRSAQKWKKRAKALRPARGEKE